MLWIILATCVAISKYFFKYVNQAVYLSKDFDLQLVAYP